MNNKIYILNASTQLYIECVFLIDMIMITIQI